MFAGGGRDLLDVLGGAVAVVEGEGGEEGAEGLGVREPLVGGVHEVDVSRGDFAVSGSGVS